MRFLLLFSLAGLLSLSTARANWEMPTGATPLKVKVVIVTTFEIGADTGDTPGEYQYWIERRKMDHVISLPAAYHDVRADDQGVIAIVTGEGISNATASTLALGLDPRFDLTKAYWLVAGIAGVNPEHASIGSAVWNDYEVDGSLAHEIDAREMPADWSTGYFPLGASHPFPDEHPNNPAYNSITFVYQLRPSLTAWAYALTKDIGLADTPALKTRRMQFAGFPAAQTPPRVLMGGDISSNTFWHGKLMSRWASEWVRYWTDKKGEYFTCAMENIGVLRSLTNLTKVNRADIQRLLLLRTGSNYDEQTPGMTAAESMAQENAGAYSGYFPALEAAFSVGNRVVTEIVEHWESYADKVP